VKLLIGLLYEPDFGDGPEELNQDGETFQVVIARSRQKITLGTVRLSLPEAISAADEVMSAKISLTNHLNQRFFDGRWHSVDPVPGK
jgi:hypothetical protein